jgi:hypothetical protein
MTPVRRTWALNNVLCDCDRLSDLDMYCGYGSVVVNVINGAESVAYPIVVNFAGDRCQTQYRCELYTDRLCVISRSHMEKYCQRESETGLNITHILLSISVLKTGQLFMVV